VEVRGERVEGNRASGGRIERDRSQERSTRQETVTPTVTPSESRSRGSRDGVRESNRSRDNARYGSNDRNRDGNRDRSADRSRTRDESRYRNRDESRSQNSDRNRRNDSYRESSRYGRSGSSRYGTSSRYGNRSPFRYSGRVRSVYPYGGGYRIWLTGCQYPFFIPSAYYHRDRFRVGLTIALGGFYNSRGYYDYYDDYDNDRYYDVRTSRGELRGVVESVDYRRETFVVRNEATGSFVTVAHNDRGRDPVRAGDYVELGGDWTRNGVFEAYRVDIVDYDRRR
jgi:hypothetical protein